MRLYSCSVAIPATAQSGTYPLRLSRLVAADRMGTLVPVAGADGALVVHDTEPLRACAGDCDGDGTVTVDEVLTCVDIGIAELPLGPPCPACDVNGNGTVAVDEIVTAVNGALNGCR
jgi:hypothetical protein